MTTHRVARIAGLLITAACSLLPALATEPAGAGANWAHVGGGSGESGFSRLDQISAANVGRLGLTWYVDLPGEVSLEATPLAVNGLLYFTGGYGTVYAVDGVSGRSLWRFDPQTWKYDPAKLHYMLAVNRGVAYAGGRVFSAALDGRLFALDAGTGKLLWSVQTLDPKSVQDITGAPCAFDGKVIIGNTGADAGARGYVTAYDAATGREVWRFYVVPGTASENRGDPAMERAAATWTGSYWKTGTGGAVWDSMTFDREFNRIYLGTGNPGPLDPMLRSPGGGDNLYTDSIVALNAHTGKLEWAYQVNPRDEWDYDATQSIILADLLIQGKRRPVLLQAPKNGFFYVLDRRTGKLISAGKIGKVTWAERVNPASGRPIEAQGSRYDTSGEATVWPSPIGAHSWQAMSFSPETGFAYIPYMQLGARFTAGKPVRGSTRFRPISMSLLADGPGDGKGALLAWDPVHQRAAWRVPRESIWNGGTLATAGNLVFQGTEEGMLFAYDASTGRRLWSFSAGLGIIAAPMSYAAGGSQYVSVLVGYGGSTWSVGRFTSVRWRFAAPRRLLTFKLGGRAQLPPSAAPDRALDDPSYRLDPRSVAAGRALYGACAICHGSDLGSSGAPAPDLRASRVALDPDSLWRVVHGGALLPGGMPRFETLTREQVMDIYAYIRAGAREYVRTQTERR
ncbi:MAG TPA: PQQ-dependent dehydrogenase, methanol/ethanol family [Steroidobacteraceae bacterium]|nr:PQQ-dependent dehydrogenase, methanol/ethanol family [Steroidobacteraceae bacterium]